MYFVFFFGVLLSTSQQRIHGHHEQRIEYNFLAIPKNTHWVRFFQWNPCFSDWFVKGYCQTPEQYRKIKKKILKKVVKTRTKKHTPTSQPALEWVTSPPERLSSVAGWWPARKQTDRLHTLSSTNPPQLVAGFADCRQPASPSNSAQSTASQRRSRGKIDAFYEAPPWLLLLPAVPPINPQILAS